jgi:ERCC4-type nuclease
MLESADFAFAGKGPGGHPLMVGVERKVISDLLTSLRKGRLQGLQGESGSGQLPRLQQAYDVAWLLVEGAYKVGANDRIMTRGGKGTAPGGWTQDTLTKQLLSLELQGGLHIHQTASLTASVQWLTSCVRWFTDKSWAQHSTMQVMHQQNTGVHVVSRFRSMVMHLTDVGLSMSKALDVRCAGKLDTLLRLTVAEIAAIKITTPAGLRAFGAARAEVVWSELHK